jgi:hypothetical protein
MKAKRKHVGIKTKKKRDIVVAIFLGFVIVVSAFYFLRNQSQQQTPNSGPVQLKAAIVDQLSLTLPNQTFVQAVTSIMEQANYTVDYYSGENVTVGFYRNLAMHGYQIIILRVHSALGQDMTPPLAFFTSEAYSESKYVYEQFTDQLVSVTYNISDPDAPSYFGVWPGFVESSMNGRFQNTMIIAMGCNGLYYTSMAEAFIEKGASAFIGWYGPVSASHTDTATIHLLQHLLIEKETLKESILETDKEVGPDPAYDSVLIYYPLEAGDQTIESFNGKS